MKDDLILIFIIGIGGFVGAISRYGLGEFVQARYGSAPLGTLAVNFLGSFLLAVVLSFSEYQGPLSERLRVFLAIGVMGSFTTMSTFSHQSVKLLEDGEFLQAGANIIGTVLLVLAAIALGKMVVVGVWGSN